MTGCLWLLELLFDFFYLCIVCSPSSHRHLFHLLPSCPVPLTIRCLPASFRSLCAHFLLRFFFFLASIRWPFHTTTALPLVLPLFASARTCRPLLSCLGPSTQSFAKYTPRFSLVSLACLLASWKAVYSMTLFLLDTSQTYEPFHMSSDGDAASVAERCAADTKCVSSQSWQAKNPGIFPFCIDASTDPNTALDLFGLWLGPQFFFFFNFFLGAFLFGLCRWQVGLCSHCLTGEMRQGCLPSPRDLKLPTSPLSLIHI